MTQIHNTPRYFPIEFLTETVVGMRHEHLTSRYDGISRGQDGLDDHVLDLGHEQGGVLPFGLEVAQEGAQRPLVPHVLGGRIVRPENTNRKAPKTEFCLFLLYRYFTK